MTIADAKYVSFTTFTRDGTPKPTPVWIADLGDNQAGFTTEATSWKVKRLANNANVELRPSNARGDAIDGREVVTATAEVVPGEFARVQGLIKKKYGVAYTLINLFHKVKGLFGKGAAADTAVIVTLP